MKALINTTLATLLERKAKTLFKTIGGLQAIELLFTSSDTVCKT